MHLCVRATFGFVFFCFVPLNSRTNPFEMLTFYEEANGEMPTWRGFIE